MKTNKQTKTTHHAEVLTASTSDDTTLNYKARLLHLDTHCLVQVQSLKMVKLFFFFWWDIKLELMEVFLEVLKNIKRNFYNSIIKANG